MPVSPALGVAIAILVLLVVAVICIGVLMAQKTTVTVAGGGNGPGFPELPGFPNLPVTLATETEPSPGPKPKPVPASPSSSPSPSSGLKDLYLTWYGVQTNGVVVPDQYLTNAARIVNYFVQSPMPYTGIMLHLDPPTGMDIHGGKPPNFAAYPELMADIVGAVPIKYRVGVHAVLEADAVWQIAPSTILDKSKPVALPIGPDSTTSPLDVQRATGQPRLGTAANRSWYGGPGSETDHALYQTLFKGWKPDDPAAVPTPDTTDPSTGACPYALKSYTTTEWPSGCPGNAARLGWYVCCVNAILRARGSKQQLSMVNWDAEFNGPVGASCTVYQFVAALQQYGTPLDVLPLVHGSTRAPWKMMLNGSSDLSPDVAYASCPDPAARCTPCYDWSNQALDPPVLVGSATYTTFGQVAVVDAAGEWYWFKGEDLGNNMYEARYGMDPTLWARGFEGCPQSSPGKDLYDNKCGCRRTVYEALKNQPAKFLQVMAPVYDPRAALVPVTTPTFSIEHLGPATSTLEYGNCINSLNFCGTTRTKAGVPNWSCAADVKCKTRCGVMNAFGVWREDTFFKFLTLFAAKYRATSLMVYDAGFVPLTWLPTQTAPALAGTPLAAALAKPYVVPDCSGTPTPPGPCSDKAATAAEPYCTLTCPVPQPR